MFSLTTWVMLLTLDENVPRHQDRIANPGRRPGPGQAWPLGGADAPPAIMKSADWFLSITGLVLRPHATEISFNRSEPTGYSRYTDQLHQLLQRE